MYLNMEVLFASVKDIVLAAFPNASTRRTVKVDVRERYEMNDTWGGGSRTEPRFVHIASLAVVDSSAVPQSALQVVANPFNQPIGTIVLTPGYCVVEHIIFRGKDLGYRMVMHPDNIPKALPENTSAPTSVDERDLRILATYRCLKSGPYRQEGLEALKYTDQDKARLSGLGYIKVSSNGATAITAEGRIICSHIRVS